MHCPARGVGWGRLKLCEKKDEDRAGVRPERKTTAWRGYIRKSQEQEQTKEKDGAEWSYSSMLCGCGALSPPLPSLSLSHTHTLVYKYKETFKKAGKMERALRTFSLLLSVLLHQTENSNKRRRLLLVWWSAQGGRTTEIDRLPQLYFCFVFFSVGNRPTLQHKKTNKKEITKNKTNPQRGELVFFFSSSSSKL